MSPINTPKRFALPPYIPNILFLLGLSLFFAREPLFAVPGETLFGPDVLGAFYPWLVFARTRLAMGELPLWFDAQFSGTPFFANPQVALYFPLSWLPIIFGAHLGWGLFVAASMWIMSTGMLLFVRYLWHTLSNPDASDIPIGIVETGAMLAGIAYGIGGVVGPRWLAGNPTVVGTYALLPWTLLASLWALRQTNRIRFAAGIVAVGFCLGLAFLAGHPSSMTYLLVIVGAFWLYQAILMRRLIPVVLLGVGAALVAVLVSGIQLIPTVELALNGTTFSAVDPEVNGFEYTLPAAELMRLVVAHLYGTLLLTPYFSTLQVWDATYYIGILPVLAVAFALMQRRHHHWFLLALILYAVLMSLGAATPVYGFFLNNVPGFSFVRAPARALAIYTFAGATLSGLALPEAYLWVHHHKRSTLWLILGSAIGALLLVVFALISTGAFAGHPDLRPQMYQMQQHTAVLVTAALMGLVLLAWWRLTVAHQKQARTRLPQLWAAAFTIFVLIDIGVMPFLYIRKQQVPPSAVWPIIAEQVRSNASRIYSYHYKSPSNNASLTGLLDANGYDPLRVGAYDQFLPFESPYLSVPRLDVVAVEYVYAEEPLPYLLQNDFTLVIEDNISGLPLWLARRTTPLPRSRLVYEYRVEVNPVTALALLDSGTVVPAETVLLDTTPPCELATPPVGSQPSAEITAAEPEYLQIITSSPTPALLILADTAYPGWHVTIDGLPAEWQTAYTVVRAVCVPSGDHIVEWQFQPISLWIGAGFSLVGLVVVITVLGLYLRDQKSSATVQQ